MSASPGSTNWMTFAGTSAGRCERSISKTAPVTYAGRCRRGCVSGSRWPGRCTPIRREEFLIGKALAAFVPTLVIAYAVFGIFLGAAALFANPVIDSAIYAGTHVLVQLVFTPLLAGWAIWVGIAVFAWSTDVRAAQQLSVLGDVPPLVILALMSLNVITVLTALTLGLAAALLAVDLLAWRVVAPMFDRERLVTGRPG